MRISFKLTAWIALSVAIVLSVNGYLRASGEMARLERETGIPIYDTVSTVVWKQLRMAGFDTRQVMEWGRLFQEVV